jgi:hypothetical protein
MNRIKLSSIAVVVVLVSVLFSATVSHGILVDKVRMATGKIVGITDMEIRLDTGVVFLPSPEITEMPFQNGDTVTVWYFVNPEGKYLYLGIAQGAITTPDMPPPPFRPGNNGLM